MTQLRLGFLSGVLMLYSNILAHARRCAPAESCGFV
ncbi:phage tail protein, partial [Escherichia coli]